MKRIMFVALMCAFMATPALSSLSWNYLYADGTGTSLTSPYSGAIVDTFDSAGSTPAGWTYTGNFHIATGDVSGAAAAPDNPYAAFGGPAPDDTPYLAVPDAGTPTNPYVDVYFGGGTYSYLGLMWGSMDVYNQIDFFSGGVGGTNVGTITGPDVARTIAEGDWLGMADNGYVNIFSTAGFDTVRITSFGGFGGSSPYAFELDNLAIQVPAPGAILLGAIGMSLVGYLRRRRAL